MKKVDFRILLVVNIGLSIILPVFIFPMISLNLTKVESVMSALVTAILLFIIEIFIYINIMYQTKVDEQVLLNLNFESDSKLFNIMQHLRSINRSSFYPNDLFRFYLNKKINDLNELSNDAVNKKEIKIEDTMIEITNEMYHSAFIGDQYSIFRPVYMCNDNEFFFEGFGKSYFEIANSLVKQRKIKKVKRLFVYSNDDELNDIRIKKLIYFHNSTSNFECKVLRLAVYNSIKNDFNLNYVTGTFAVYGSRYLYTERTAPTMHQIIGYYSKKTNAIQDFTNFFERCWQQAQQHIVTSSKKINVDDIFDEGWVL